MEQRPLVLLTPSQAAAWELLRRLASSGRALAGIYPFKLKDLARALAEPALLGRACSAWDSGHAALLAARFLDGPHGLTLPRGPAPRTPGARPGPDPGRPAPGGNPARSGSLPWLREESRAPRRPRAAARAGRAPPPLPRERRGSLRRSAPPSYARRRAQVAARRSGSGGEHPRGGRARPRRRRSRSSWPPSRKRSRASASSGACLPVSRHGSFAAWAEAQRACRGRASRTRCSLPSRRLGRPRRPARVCARPSSSRPAAGQARDGSVELVTAPGEAAEAAAIARRLLREAAPRRALRGDGRAPAPARRVRADLHRSLPARAAFPAASIPRCRSRPDAPRARCCCSSAAAGSRGPRSWSS